MIFFLKFLLCVGDSTSTSKSSSTVPSISTSALASEAYSSSKASSLVGGDDLEAKRQRLLNKVLLCYYLILLFMTRLQ